MVTTAVRPTPAQARTELARRAGVTAETDTIAFCRLYRPEVKHPTRGFVVFEPFEYEQRLLWELDHKRQVVVLKSRQTGVTTTVMLHALRRCQRPATTIRVVSIGLDEAQQAVSIAADALSRLDPAPDSLQLKGANKTALEFANGSTLTAEPSTQDTGRGVPASAVILDEVAALRWQEEMWRALAPTTSLGGAFILVSTPQMEGDLFHERWEAANVPGSEWTPLQVHWRERPDYDEAWYAATRPNYTEAQWASEFELEFGRAADAVFKSEFVRRAQELGAGPWERGEKAVFVLGGDLAGEGRSFSVLVVLDLSVQPVRVVAVRSWESLPAPSLQAEIERAADEFGCVPWLDRTGLGWGVIENLQRRCIGVSITGGNTITGHAGAPNVPRTLLVNNLVLGLEQEQLGIPPEFTALLRGLRAYRWKKEGVANADFVDALAIAWAAATLGRRGGVTLRSDLRF